MRVIVIPAAIVVVIIDLVLFKSQVRLRCEQFVQLHCIQILNHGLSFLSRVRAAMIVLFILAKSIDICQIFLQLMKFKMDMCAEHIVRKNGHGAPGQIRTADLLDRDQKVGGSNPLTSTNLFNNLRGFMGAVPSVVDEL